jgi:hypothetical protein
MHISDLRGKYHYHGLDITEMRAVWTCLPRWTGGSSTSPKAVWKNDFRAKLITLTIAEIMGTLRGNEKRNPAYSTDDAHDALCVDYYSYEEAIDENMWNIERKTQQRCYGMSPLHGDGVNKVDASLPCYSWSSSGDCHIDETHVSPTDTIKSEKELASARVSTLLQERRLSLQPPPTDLSPIHDFIPAKLYVDTNIAAESHGIVCSNERERTPSFLSPVGPPMRHASIHGFTTPSTRMRNRLLAAMRALSTSEEDGTLHVDYCHQKIAGPSPGSPRRWSIGGGTKSRDHDSTLAETPTVPSHDAVITTPVTTPRRKPAQRLNCHTDTSTKDAKSQPPVWSAGKPIPVTLSWNQLDSDSGIIPQETYSYWMNMMDDDMDANSANISDRKLVERKYTPERDVNTADRQPYTGCHIPPCSQQTPLKSILKQIPTAKTASALDSNKENMNANENSPVGRPDTILPLSSGKSPFSAYRINSHKKTVMFSPMYSNGIRTTPATTPTITPLKPVAATSSADAPVMGGFVREEGGQHNFGAACLHTGHVNRSQLFYGEEENGSPQFVDSSSESASSCASDESSFVELWGSEDNADDSCSIKMVMTSKSLSSNADNEMVIISNTATGPNVAADTSAVAPASVANATHPSTHTISRDRVAVYNKSHCRRRNTKKKKALPETPNNNIGVDSDDDSFDCVVAPTPPMVDFCEYKDATEKDTEIHATSMINENDALYADELTKSCYLDRDCRKATSERNVCRDAEYSRPCTNLSPHCSRVECDASKTEKHETPSFSWKGFWRAFRSAKQPAKPTANTTDCGRSHEKSINAKNPQCRILQDMVQLIEAQREAQIDADINAEIDNFIIPEELTPGSAEQLRFEGLMNTVSEEYTSTFAQTDSSADPSAEQILVNKYVVGTPFITTCEIDQIQYTPQNFGITTSLILEPMSALREFTLNTSSSLTFGMLLSVATGGIRASVENNTLTVSKEEANDLLMQVVEEIEDIGNPLELLMLLIDLLGADPNICDEYGSTPLHRLFSKPLLGRYLISRGADILRRDKNGESVLQLCLEYGYYEEWLGTAIDTLGKEAAILSSRSSAFEYVRLILVFGGYASKIRDITSVGAGQTTNALISEPITSVEALDLLDECRSRGEGAFAQMKEPVETFELLEDLILS